MHGKPDMLPYRRRQRSVAAVVLVIAAAAGLVLAACSPTPPAGAPLVTVYTNPSCQCCVEWIDHLKSAGFAVRTEHPDDLAKVRASLGVPEPYAACHTAVVQGRVIEGHVPAVDIERLLADPGEARGLAVPAMPIGSPGMEGPTAQGYRVYLLKADGSASLYARHEPAGTRAH